MAKIRIIDDIASNSDDMLTAVAKLKRRCPWWQPLFDQTEAEIHNACLALERDIAQNGHFVPNKNDLFRAFELTPLPLVRVVIIGQDPYPQILANGVPQARGIAFSVDYNVKIPSSLNNIYKLIEKNIPGYVRPDHGNLEHWTAQGVLLLNSCLTCLPNQPNVHGKKMVWKPFIAKVLNLISLVRPNCIYVMWGAEAQKLAQYTGDRSIKLMAAHPSGLAAARCGFFDVNHFAEINQLLTSFGETPIIW